MMVWREWDNIMVVEGKGRYDGDGGKWQRGNMMVVGEDGRRPI